MKNKILWLLTLLPAIVTTVVIQFMPAQIPAHYDAIGNIDRWGSKYENFIFPAIIIFVTLHWIIYLRYFRKKQLTAVDDKSKNEAIQNEKVIYYVALGMAILFGIMHYSFMLSAILSIKNNLQTMAIDINVVVNVVAGVFFIIIGNTMPKSKLNGIVGVRTKWSMKNDITWSKSNRFGGIMFIISGFSIIVEAMLIGGVLSTIIMLGLLVLSTVIVSVYSYVISMKLD